MRKINKIIIHCTATPLNATVYSIKNYHMRLGYSDIGYHYLIDPFGYIHSGRELESIGAHCKGHNRDSIGIALIGGQDGKFDFTKLQILSLINLVDKLQIMFHNKLLVFGHNDFTKNKTCPNFDVKNFFAYEDK